jgi:hypothetical protein
MSAHVTHIVRRGSGWGYQCSCGHAPNVSSKQRRVAEKRARLHKAIEAKHES